MNLLNKLKFLFTFGKSNDLNIEIQKFLDLSNKLHCILELRLENKILLLVDDLSFSKGWQKVLNKEQQLNKFVIYTIRGRSDFYRTRNILPDNDFNLLKEDFEGLPIETIYYLVNKDLTNLELRHLLKKTCSELFMFKEMSPKITLTIFKY